MKATNSKDGIRRIDLRVNVRLSAEDFASALTSHFSNNVRNEIIGLAKALSDRKMIEIIKEEIISEGLESFQYSIGDNNLNEVLEEMTELIEGRFPELKKKGA